MTKFEILRAIEPIKKGTFTRIVYTSLPTLSAAGKKAGVEVVKHTQKVVRLGVHYGNIAAVKQAEAERTEPKREVTPWSHWEIPDILAKHNTKDAYYLSFASVNKGHNTKTVYYVNGEEVTKQFLEESGYVIPSYFKNNGELPVVQKVNIENIISIGESRE